MAAIVIRENAEAIPSAALVVIRARACAIVQRAMFCAAATIMICAVGVALLHLTVQILSLPAPIAVIAMTLMAAALLNSLRRRLLTLRRTGRMEHKAERCCSGSLGRQCIHG